jgi:hypothetical protein
VIRTEIGSLSIARIARAVAAAEIFPFEKLRARARMSSSGWNAATPLRHSPLTLTRTRGVGLDVVCPARAMAVLRDHPDSVSVGAAGQRHASRFAGFPPGGFELDHQR